mgnify:CR=1 FL=1
MSRRNYVEDRICEIYLLSFDSIQRSRKLKLEEEKNVKVATIVNYLP